MSSILSAESSTPAIELGNAQQGLDIVAQDNQVNYIIFEEVENPTDLGNDNVIGGNSIDFFRGGKGDDAVIGGEGDDFLFGEAGDDILLGGDGTDLIRGGKGSDVLSGGAGDDIFEFFGPLEGNDFAKGELDHVLDFTVGEDVIRVKGFARNSELKYDTETGKISVDGQDLVQLDKGLDIDIEGEGDGNWELF